MTDAFLSSSPLPPHPPITGKVNSFVSLSEDYRLSVALKCIDLGQSTVGQSAEMPQNNLRRPVKKLDEPTRRLAGREKVRCALELVIFLSADLFAHELPGLDSLCSQFIEAAQKGLRTEKEEEETADPNQRRSSPPPPRPRKACAGKKKDSSQETGPEKMNGRK